MRQGWETDEWGDKYHYVDGKLHSINDEPAAIYSNGAKIWCKENRWHRETGPALIYPSGRKEYYFEGNCYPDITSDLEWLLKVEELKRELDI
jgi:hypothetical protein